MRWDGGDWSGGRGIEAMRAKMLRTGLTPSGQPLWTDAEFAALRKHWPDRKKLRRALPRRTLRAIEHKAGKLGLRRAKRNHMWTAAEVARLKKMFPKATKAELLLAFPWAIWEDLSNQAQFQRSKGADWVTRPKPKPLPTDVPAIDWVLDQAFAANISLVELDGLARTGTYFAAGRFRCGTVWKHVARAVELFDGILVPREEPTTPPAPDRL